MSLDKGLCVCKRDFRCDISSLWDKLHTFNLRVRTKQLKLRASHLFFITDSETWPQAIATVKLADKHPHRIEALYCMLIYCHAATVDSCFACERQMETPMHLRCSSAADLVLSESMVWNSFSNSSSFSVPSEKNAWNSSRDSLPSSARQTHT